MINIPKKPMDYAQLSESTKQRYSSMLEKVHKSGYTSKELLKMNDNDFRNALGTKAKNLNSQRSLVRNMSKGTSRKDTKERQEGLINRVVKSYKKSGIKGKQLTTITKEVKKSIGYNKFFDIAKDLQQYYGETNEQSWKHAHDIIILPKKLQPLLDQKEIDILSEYDTP